MEELVFLLIMMAVVCVLCGPAALIVSIVAFKKADNATRQPSALTAQPSSEPTVIAKPPKSLQLPKQPIITIAQTIGRTPEKAKEKVVSLEQRIGTQWVLIAGVITVFIAAGFFLKFAYEHYWISPWGRICIAVVAGIVSLATGEITRRRGYEIAAKGTTALGFAILYAADFAAYRFYGLIGPVPAFAAAIVITVAALVYAVALDEVVAAFLAMLGGFATPVIVSTGENTPVPLFGYVLVLSSGAMLCAYWRKWRAINLLAFAGTFLLYAGWFEKFFRPQLHGSLPPEQLTIALGWLGIFFTIYLVLPLLYGLAKKAIARGDDVCLVVINAAWTFYYLWTILFERYRETLAPCVAGLSAAHFVMMGLVFIRCRDDKALRQALLVIGLAFLTTAIPLYWQMNAVILGWTIEGLILVFIGVRYRSILTQAGGVLALVLSCAKLVWQLPMHTDTFRPVSNPTFGMWLFVAAVIYACDLIYRLNSTAVGNWQKHVSEIFYLTAVLILMAAAILEWDSYCQYNVAGSGLGDIYFPKGIAAILSVSLLLFAARPLCPQGLLSRLAATVIAMVASAFIVLTFPEFHNDAFKAFVNIDFLTGLLIVAALFGASFLMRIAAKANHKPNFQVVLSTLGILVLWALLTEEIYAYWQCRNGFVQEIANWRFIANMWISVAWAIYGIVLLIGGFWRKLKMLRYIGLLVLGVLLLKAFIVDMNAVSTIYRIMAFLATGVTLVGVSYLYHFLKKKGFFDTTLAKSSNKNSQ